MKWIGLALPVHFLVRLGVHQQFAVRIKTRDSVITNGSLFLEPQTEGLEITRTDKVPAKLTTKDGDIKELELTMNENKLILLPPCEAHEELELFVVYEGSYTEFDYRVKLNERVCLGGRRLLCYSSSRPLFVVENDCRLHV